MLDRPPCDPGAPAPAVPPEEEPAAYRPGAFRGIALGLPLSIMLWILIWLLLP